MMNPRRVRASSLFAGLLLLGGCASRQVDPATLAPDTLYQQATAAFEAHKYDRAIKLLEAFAGQHVGDPRAPQARLMLGQAHMAKKEYLTAATEFQRLISDFPSSPLNLEARSGICEAYYRISPKPQLDQEYTVSARAHCSSVASIYPDTPQGEEAARHVAQLDLKMAQKALGTGEFYFKRKVYDAAAVYFSEVIDGYPQTPVAPTALERLVETYTRLGYVEEAAQARERLLKDYPDSPEAHALQATPAAAPGPTPQPAPGSPSTGPPAGRD